MKNLHRNFALLILVTFLAFGFGCTKEEPTPKKPPGELPKIPTSPNLPADISSVAKIRSGAISKGTEVYLYGHLTGQKSDDKDEWFFTDDGGATVIILDFPTSQVPLVNSNILVYGGVEDAGEVDVISWMETNNKPDTPEPPKFPPAGVTPPGLELTTVDQIAKGVKTGEVILSGELTHQQDDDCDEWVFNDGTGSIEVDFPSCNVPAVGVPIYIYGKTDGRYEIDVFSWQPQ